MKQDSQSSAPEQDAEALGREISGILERLVGEYLEWSNGFNAWINQAMLNFQQVPPQAYAEVAARERWILGVVRQFYAAGEILARNGDKRLADLVDTYSKGFDKLVSQRQATYSGMAEENADTQRQIAGIHANMAAENLKAAADRHRLQMESAAYVQKQTAEGLARQQESFGEMNDAIKYGLFGR